MRDIEEAWGAYFAANATVDIDAMNADGWRTLQQIADITGTTGDAAKHILRRSTDIERKKCRVVLNGQTRAINFYRPK